jgi:hypothetical protein
LREYRSGRGCNCKKRVRFESFASRAGAHGGGVVVGAEFKVAGSSMCKKEHIEGELVTNGAQVCIRGHVLGWERGTQSERKSHTEHQRYALYLLVGNRFSLIFH